MHHGHGTDYPHLYHQINHILFVESRFEKKKNILKGLDALSGCNTLKP